MDQGLLVILLGIVVFICLMALFIIMHVLFKSWIEETKQHARDAAGRSLAIGFVNALFLTALSIGFWVLAENAGIPALGLIGVVIIVALIIAAVFGITGMVVLISERLFPEARGWRQLAGGGSLTVLACLTPYVGWFGLFPYVFFRGLGGFIQSLARSWRARRTKDELSAD
jgi:hypothetical protein